MAKKSLKQKKLNIEIVAKTPFAGSGPRGVDVYANHLYEELSRSIGSGKIYLARDSAKQKDVDLVHYTFFDPFFLTLWGRTRRSKYVVTVHDLIPLVFPTQFKSGLRGKFKWLLQKRALLNASAIITDSVCSKTDIHKLAGIDNSKIHVVPLAPGHTTVNEKLVRTVKQEYRLPNDYLLYVGDINWNKNIPGLINAFGKLKSAAVDLVLVGKAFASSQGTKEYESIKDSIERSGKSIQIHILGFVPSHHLPAIYRAALLYVQPSFYEGFGFPLLEAMEQSCPVASSLLGSLQEVGGSYAHYFDPNNPASFIKLIDSLIVDKQKREMYVAEARIWAKSFTWDKVVEDTYAVYEKITH